MIFNRISYHWGKEPKLMCSWTVCNLLGSFVSLGGFPSIWSMVYCLGRLLPLAKLVTGLNDTLCSSMINPLTFANDSNLSSLRGASNWNLFWPSVRCDRFQPEGPADWSPGILRTGASGRGGGEDQSEMSWQTAASTNQWRARGGILGQNRWA